MAAFGASRWRAVIGMPLTNSELHALLQATEESSRALVAQAVLMQDVRARQLSVLRNTYSVWNIDIEPDSSGALWWVAMLRCEHTPELVRAGVFQTIRQSDAIALAATLAWQSSLIHGATRTRHEAPSPRPVVVVRLRQAGV